MLNRLLLLLPMACTPPADAPLSVALEQTVTLADVSSGSALSLVEEEAFLIGDDSPYLFRLVPPYERVSQRHLLLPEFAETDRIPKPQKPDWESVAEGTYEGEPHLFVFGSGSKSPERDSLLIINPRHPEQVRRHSLTALYNRIGGSSPEERASLNLEGSVVTGGELLLFNRGDNGIIRIGWEEFLEYLAGEKEAGELRLERHRVTLPEINGSEARFSGACFVPGEDLLLFTATVEDTDNWIDDGEILGSYIGLLPLPDLLTDPKPQTALLLDKAGAVAKDKVESITFQGFTADQDLLALAVTDNDDGSSKLLKLRISRRNP